MASSSSSSDSGANSSGIRDTQGHVHFPFFWTMKDEEEQRLGYIELLPLGRIPLDGPLAESVPRLASSVVPRGAAVTPASLADVRNCQDIGFSASFAWIEGGSDLPEYFDQDELLGGTIFLAEKSEKESDSTYDGVKKFLSSHGAKLEVYDAWSNKKAPSPPEISSA